MLSVPIFKPWRPLWDEKLFDALRRADELTLRRTNGRSVPPRLRDPFAARQILYALHVGQIRNSDTKFIQKKLQPLLDSSVWPRWLSLESTLEIASSSGDLHLAALVLRAQIEELDVLRDVDAFLSINNKHPVSNDTLIKLVSTLKQRVLPRLEPKTGEQLKVKANDFMPCLARPKKLQNAFDQLGEYVHPNYGSHLLMVRPHDIEVGKILLAAFAAIYDEFFSFPWTVNKRTENGPARLNSARQTENPFVVLATVTIPNLKHFLSSESESTWEHAAECFLERAANDNRFDDLTSLSIDSEALRILKTANRSPNEWPEIFRTAASRERHALLVFKEKELSQSATRLLKEPNSALEDEGLKFLLLALDFAVLITEQKIFNLSRHAARLLNEANILGAGLTIRSIYEHHALAVELGHKLLFYWESAEKKSASEEAIREILAEAEKQIARVLSGSSNSLGLSSVWRDRWLDTVRKPFNILGPIQRLDKTVPGFLQAYGLLSHFVHGTVGTGGDLLSGGGDDWSSGNHQTTAQFILFLKLVCSSDATLDRLAASLTVADRLSVVGRATDIVQGMIGARLMVGQKLKAGRDIFGSGTQTDPYRFRESLRYHDAYTYYLAQEGINVRIRTTERLHGGIGDKVESNDGRIIYFFSTGILKRHPL